MPSPKLNSGIELHDSVLASLKSVEDKIEIAFRPAYIHRTEGIPGVDPGTGWTQDIVLVVESGVVEGQVAELPFDVSDGELQVAGLQLQNVLPLPLDYRGNIELRLLLKSSEQLVIRGSRITSESAGTAKYIEDFPGMRSR
jgi:hypothetical protein